jgi:hypothetical protein
MTGTMTGRPEQQLNVCLWCQNDFMKHCLLVSLWRMSALISTLALPVTTRSPTYQFPVPQVERADTQTKLTVADEQDSYEIYSILLRTEVGPQWKIAVWAITHQTQTFPNSGSRPFHDVRECLSVSRDQKPIYLPLIEDYVAKNSTKQVLERKFDLPEYVLVDFGRTSRRANPPLASTPIIFEVSAVGFNRDRTRALVYVGHHCGSLCGGGRYHLLVKKEDKWQVDGEYRGMSCGWSS